MKLLRVFLFLAFNFFALCSSASELTEPPFCQKLVTSESTNAIIDEVFYAKFKRLAKEYVLEDEFVDRTGQLTLVVCDNPSSYDTFVVYGEGVVFDVKMLGFLFAQARALMLGRYLGLDQQFVRHKKLVDHFVETGGAVGGGPVQLIVDQAIQDGVEGEQLKVLFADPEFKTREQKLFLQSLYFLSMHERCHVHLGHGEQLKSLSKRSASEQTAVRHKMELAADRCSQKIINLDEARHNYSPVSFFGVMLIVTTQYLVHSQPGFSTLGSHPSSKDRIEEASEVALNYVQATAPDQKENYEATLKGTSNYFSNLIGGE